MNKSAGELDQPLVESVTRGVALGQPELLENVVGFIKELLVEALEITKVMRIVRFALTGCNQRSDFF